MRPRRHEREFLPAALELRETPPSPAGRALLWSVVGLLAATLAWAAASDVDVVAAAPGRVVPSGRSKVVQPVEGGVVRAIRVRDGEHVAHGQLLVELDDEAPAAEVARVAGELGQSERELHRLQRLGALAGDAETLADEPAPVASDPLLAARWLAHSSRIDSLEAERARRAAERDTLQQQADKLDALLPYLQRRARDQAALAGRSLVPAQQHRDAQQALTEASEEREVQRRRVAGAEAALTEAGAQLRETRAEFRRLVAEQRDEAERRTASLAQELIKARARLKAHRLTAPVGGTVQQLAVHTVGGVVSPAQTLMVVVPDEAPIEVEALVANKDAGFVAAGQFAEVKLEPFPFTRYGTVPGVVEQLSRDAVADEKFGPVYKASVRLARDHLLHEGRRLALSPGMAATVEIRTGSRRVLDFVLSPLRQHLHEAARER